MGRLSVIGGNGKIYSPFCISDFLSFGYVSDMMKLYGIKRQKINVKEERFIQNHKKINEKITKILENCKLNAYSPIERDRKLLNFNRMMKHFLGIYGGETYIMSNFYLENIGAIDHDRLLETYHKFLKDYIIVVDDFSILWDWPKYESRRHNIYPGIPYYNNLNHGIWLNLYNS